MRIRLATVRNQLGITQQEAADRCGLTIEKIRRTEQIGLKALDGLREIADGLGVDVAVLVSENAEHALKAQSSSKYDPAAFKTSVALALDLNERESLGMTHDKIAELAQTFYEARTKQ